MLFLKGILLGICVSAPIGPVGLLCIRRALQSGFWAGVSSGLGAALADTLYAALTVLGVAIVSEMLREHDTAVRIVGGALLIIIAARAFFSKPQSGDEVRGKTMLGHLVSSFALTVSNPATIIGFAALFAGLGMVTSDDKIHAFTFISGVFLGSMIWWGILSGLVARMRSSRLAERAETINHALGILLGLFGVWMIASPLL